MHSSNFIYGIHAVHALLLGQSELIREVYVISGRQDGRVRDLISLVEQKEIKLAKVSRAEIEKLVGPNSVHQGVVALCRRFSGLDESVLKTLVASDKEKLFLILDGVQDPHNLGACLRSAAAFAATAVIAPQDKACGLTPVVRKVACGGAEITPFIQVKNLSRTLAYLQQEGVWLVGLASDGEAPISDIDLTGNIGLVLGSEGQGMRKLTRKHCDYLAHIPMLGEMESVNVSVAAGVVLYEAVRQRSLPLPSETGSE